MDGPGSKWTVPGEKMDDPKGSNLTVQKYESGRSKIMKVEGPKRSYL